MYCLFWILLCQVEAELSLRIEEQDKAIRQKNKVIENRDSTIEQLHRRLEHAIPSPVSTVVSQSIGKVWLPARNFLNTQVQIKNMYAPRVNDNCFGDMIKERRVNNYLLFQKFQVGSCWWWLCQAVDNSKLEAENVRLKEALERQKEVWQCRQAELESSLEFRYCSESTPVILIFRVKMSMFLVLLSFILEFL